MAFSEQLSLRAVGIVGLGLIGGSMARAFQKYTTLRVYGCDTNPQTAMQAERDGAVDAAGGPELLSRCGLVLVALYPQQTVTFVRNRSNGLRREASWSTCAGSNAIRWKT